MGNKGSNPLPSSILCLCSSTVEQLPCKEYVGGAIPLIGSILTCIREVAYLASLISLRSSVRIRYALPNNFVYYKENLDGRKRIN